MSSDNWWRGPRSSGELEARGESSWPSLSPSRCNKRGRRKPRVAQDCSDDILKRITIHQAKGVDRSSLLDNEGYPKLGQRLSKRKLPAAITTSQNPPILPGGSDDIQFEKLTLESKDLTNEEDRVAIKFSKKFKRSDLICIDLKKVLERQRSLSESQTSSSPKPRIKLNLNLSIRNPLDSAALMIQCRKGKQREIPRAKRISKLKRVIFREREFKKQSHNIWKRELFDMERMQAMTKDVSEIDFNRLRISGDPAKPEVKIARNLSALNLFDNSNKYRKSPSDDTVPDDVMEESKNGVVSKLENLLLLEKRDSDDISPEMHNTREDEVLSENDCEFFQDSNILTKTLCLKICDETGETVEEFEEVPEVNPLEPPFVNVENPTAPDLLRHSRNFREYCTNELTPGLNKESEKFLAEIYRLQKRMYEKDEVKGRCRRRFYAGFKEVLKHVESKKIKFVFIAPDLEGIHGYPGGLDEFVSKLITACKIREVVFCFSLNKRKLGYYTHKKGSVSCVGITNYAGLEEIYKDVLTELMLARNSYGRYSPLEESDETHSNPNNQEDWNETLLSTKINLLFKTLTIAPCSWREPNESHVRFTKEKKKKTTTTKNTSSDKTRRDRVRETTYIVR